MSRSPSSDSSPVVRFGGPEEYLAFGTGGWAYVNLPSDFDKAVWVLVDEGTSGRLVVRGMWIELALGVTGRDLAKLPFGRIEAAINNPAVVEAVRACVESAMKPEAPVPLASPAWTSLPPLEQIAPPRTGLKVEAPRSRLKLRVPKGRNRPDDFYRQLAQVYSLQMTRSRHPASDIAQANGLATTTVHGWVKEARRRGLLAPARREERTS